jgi:hypothetical protein
MLSEATTIRRQNDNNGTYSAAQSDAIIRDDSLVENYGEF